MSKTVKEWLETLPDGYRERALANMLDAVRDKKADSLPSAIYIGFDWGPSKEGYSFWKNTFFHYKRNERSLPTLPNDEKVNAATNQVRKRKDWPRLVFLILLVLDCILLTKCIVMDINIILEGLILTQTIILFRLVYDKSHDHE